MLKEGEQIWVVYGQWDTVDWVKGWGWEGGAGEGRDFGEWAKTGEVTGSPCSRVW